MQRAGSGCGRRIVPVTAGDAGRSFTVSVVLGLAFALTLGSAAGPASAQLLTSLRDDALRIDPAVAAATALFHAAEERLYQARAAYGPVAGLTYNANGTRLRSAPNWDTQRLRGEQTVLQITQPLLRSALIPAYESAREQVEQARAQLEQARAEATIRLADAVFDVLKTRDAISLAGAQRLAASEQLTSAQRSYTVGNATIVDVRQAEAKIDTVDAQTLALEAELALKQQLLTELAGRPAAELLDRTLPVAALPPLTVDGVLGWIADAQLASPQIAAARRALAAAEAEVRKAQQAHAPTADLNVTVTRNNDNGSLTTLTPRRYQAEQIGVSITLPLFASGATQSKVREAMALRDKAQADVEAARRTVQIAVRQNFTTAMSSSALMRGLETAERSQQAALQANRRGYEVGMRVNVDVLDAQSKLYESRRDLSRSRYDAWVGWLKLKSAAGLLVEADWAELDRLLVMQPPTPPTPSRPLGERRSGPRTPAPASAAQPASASPSGGASRGLSDPPPGAVR